MYANTSNQNKEKNNNDAHIHDYYDEGLLLQFRNGHEKIITIDDNKNQERRNNQENENVARCISKSNQSIFDEMMIHIDKKKTIFLEKTIKMNKIYI